MSARCSFIIRNHFLAFASPPAIFCLDSCQTLSSQRLYIYTSEGSFHTIMMKLAACLCGLCQLCSRRIIEAIRFVWLLLFWWLQVFSAAFNGSMVKCDLYFHVLTFARPANIICEPDKFLWTSSVHIISSQMYGTLNSPFRCR